MSKVKDCIFCRIVAKEIPSKILYEDNDTLAFLDIFPISPGHTIIIPKQHYRNIEDISEEAFINTWKTTKKLALKIKKNLKVDGYNVLQNNFKAAGQEIDHFHIHIIPRGINDKKFSLNIPKFQAKEKDLEDVLKSIKG